MPNAERFDGFPAGYNVTLGAMDRKMQYFLHDAADAILDGTENTPPPVWQAHYLDMLVHTGVVDRRDPTKSLRLNVKVPITPDEFAQLRRPTFEPLPPELVARDSLALIEEEPDMQSPGVLAALFDDAVPSSSEVTGPLISSYEADCYAHNMQQLTRAEVIEQVAGSLADRYQLERFIAERGVELDDRRNPFKASHLGAHIYFEGEADLKYPLLEDGGVSVGAIRHGNYTSPITHQHVTTIGADPTSRGYYGDATIHDRDQWEAVVRNDMSVVQEILGLAVEVIRDNHADVFGDIYRGRSPKTGDAAVSLERRKEYFSGWQQFLPPGYTLLMARQEIRYVTAREYDFERTARIVVTEKKTDVSRPNTMIFWTDENPEGEVSMLYGYHPIHAGQNEFFPRIGGIYTGGLEHHKPGQALSAGTERAMRSSGMTDQDVADAVDGKRWGLELNPFSHREFYGAIDFIGSLAHVSQTSGEYDLD